MLAAAAGGETTASGRKSTDRTFDTFATEGIQIRYFYACVCFVYASLRFDVALRIILSV